MNYRPQQQATMDVTRRFGFSVAHRDMRPGEPRTPRTTPVTTARRAWRLSVCEATTRRRTRYTSRPDGSREKHVMEARRLERVKDWPTLKPAMRAAGFRKLRGKWVPK